MTEETRELISNSTEKYWTRAGLDAEGWAKLLKHRRYSAACFFF